MSTYQYPPNEPLGVLMGLSRSQVIAFGSAIGAFVIGAMTGRLLLGVAVAVVVAVVGGGQWAGVPFRARIARRVGWATSTKARRHATPIGRRRPQRMPPCLSGFRCAPVAGLGDWAAGPPLGLITARGRLSLTLPVEGPQLALLGEDGVDSRIREWGDLLSSLCTERGEGGITRISWTDVHAAADPRAAFVYHRTHGERGPASDDYERHLEQASMGTSDHHVFVTVTMSTATARRRRTLTSAGRSDHIPSVIEQTQIVARELTARGYRVGRPLSPYDTALLNRRLGDPWRTRRADLSPAERLGVPEPGDTAPSTVVNERLYVAIDSAVHRAYQINWPSRPVAGDWMWAILAAADGPKMTTIIFEPVAPSRSRRRIEVQLNRVGSDAAVEQNRKNRVSARRGAIAQALRDREHELVEGHMEMEVFGLVVLAESDVAALERRCNRLERDAMRCGGARLRPLDTLHDAGWAAALPIGMPVGRPSQ